MRLLVFSIVALSACSGSMLNDAGLDPLLDPPNLVTNPSFERGATSPVDWVPLFGEMSLVTEGARSGSRALKVVANASGDGSVGHSPAVVASTEAATYCATAWVKGTVSDVRLEVLLSPSGQGNSFGSPVATVDWIRAPPTINLNVRAQAGQQLDLRIRMHNGKAGDVLLIDSVDVYKSKDDRCAER